MGKLPKLICEKPCKGCPALPLTRKQLHNITVHFAQSSDPKDKEILKDFLNMDTLAVFCIERQKICLIPIGEETNKK